MWTRAAGVIDNHRVTCLCVSPGFCGREEGKSFWEVGRSGGSGLSMLDLPLGLSKVSENPILRKDF